MTLKAQAQVVGILVHTVAERFLTEYAERKTDKKPYQLGWLHAAKDEEFVKIFGQDALDAINAYYDEYNEACEATLEFGQSIGKSYKAPTWTGYWQRTYASRFDTLERDVFQPLQAKLKHIQFRSSLLDIYQHISRCTDNFLKLYRKYPADVEFIVELRLDPRLNIHGAMKGGRIDLIVKYPDGTVEVLDFKTGRKEWDAASVRNEPQLNWYVYGTEQQLGIMPTRKGILDLYNGKEFSCDVLPGETERFKKQLQGSIAYETRLHETIEEEGIEKALEQFPLPIGRLNIGCPCLLPYEEDDSIKCKAYKVD